MLHCCFKLFTGPTDVEFPNPFLRMIPVISGHTDMRRGMNSLALQVQARVLAYRPPIPTDCPT